MIRHDQNDLSYYSYQLFQPFEQVVSIASSRCGGASTGQHATLNLALSVGDDSQAVLHNRELLCRSLGVARESLAIAQLVHGTHIVQVTTNPHDMSTEEWINQFAATDGLITHLPDIALMVLVADCAGVSFYDPKRHVIGMGHAGWRGAVAGMARQMIESLNAAYDCNPADLLVGISPSIGPCCYEVKEDVIRAFHDAFPDQADDFFVEQPDGSTHLDMWTALTRQLHDSGVRRDHIELAGICTACHTDTFYSFRAEKGKTGRFGALIALRST